MSEEQKNKEQQEAPPLNASEEISEFAKTTIIAILLALVIRSLFFEPFNIPSGSMKPTLLVGDYLFVSKPSYGYSRYSFPLGIAPIDGRIWDAEPERGDVIVFKLPSNPSVDYIKRLIGLPGEKIEVIEGRLYINDKIVPRQFKGTLSVSAEYRGNIPMRHYIETLPNGVEHHILEESDQGPLDNFGPITVPEGHYFMMGDNRDNSQDSRVSHMVGPVPYENFVGKADFLFFSTNGHAGLFEIWKWPWTIRYDRLFDSLHADKLPDINKDELKS